jgi:hypothetical protein
MAKTSSAKGNVQFIRTPEGDDLAVMPRSEYDRLVALAAETQEEAGCEPDCPQFLARSQRGSRSRVAKNHG